MENIRFKNLIKRCEEHNELFVTNLMVMKDDKIVFDFTKKPYLKGDLQFLFSVTKSFTSVAIGILADQGKLKLDDYITKYFEEETKNLTNPIIKKIQIKHLLMMAPGNEKEAPFSLQLKGNWVKVFFEQEFIYEPGTQFTYSSLTSHMLSEIAQRITGITLEQFLKINLFDKLGITDYEWEHFEGKTVGGVGLSLKPEDMMKFGKMLLHDGIYEGKRIVSKEYLDEATRVHINKRWGGPVLENEYTPYAGRQYGYQFHIAPRSFRADGAFGQVIKVFKKENMVVVANSQNTNYDVFWTIIDKSLNIDEVKEDISKEELNQYLDSLTYENKQFSESKSPEFKGKYKLEPNVLEIDTFEFKDGTLTFNYTTGDKDLFDVSAQGSKYGMSHYKKKLILVNQKHYQEVYFEDNKLVLKILYIETPYVVHYVFERKNDLLTFQFIRNVSLYFDNFSQIPTKI